MRRITSLTPDPRNPGRVVVEVDGSPLAIVALEALGRHRLSVGAEVHPDAERALTHEAAALRTYDRAVRLLAVRARSVRELRRRLLAAQEPADQVDAAIARLVEAGVLDDAEYARQVARSQIVGRGHAPRRLQQELARRGVERRVADRAIEIVMAEDAAPGSYGAAGGVDLTESIERLARRKLRSLGGLDSDARSRRLYAFLARRGYDSDDIRGVMAKLRAEAAESDSA